MQTDSNRRASQNGAQEMMSHGNHGRDPLKDKTNNFCEKENEGGQSKATRSSSSSFGLRHSEKSQNMSETPPQKKLKQTVLKFPKTESTSDSKLGETSENNDNVQGPSAHSWKTEVGEGPTKDLKEEVDEKKHKFRVNLNSGIFSVSCTTSMTVLQALNTNKRFMTEKNKKKNKQKDIIISQRPKEDFPFTAAVKTDFPCCLIDTDEILDVHFIKNNVNDSNQQTTADPSLLRKKSEPETMVTFWIKKEGGTNVKCLMKSKALRERESVHYVCVYAFKGERVKTALKRDGRFNKVIFRKDCGLYESGSETKHEMKTPVEDLDRKTLQVVVLSADNQPESQDDWLVNSEPNVASDADVEGNVGPSQNPSNTEQEKKVAGNTESTNASATRYAAKAIVNSEETLKILRDQYPKLLEILKQRENLRNNSDVQKFFRVEYDKSVVSFSEVKKVKQLMRFSQSVCQIRVEGSARGTGFILVDRFILTNAHVIGDFDPFSGKLSKTFTAVFGYEDLEAKESKHVPIKEQVVAYYHGKIMGCNLDYALLELKDADELADCPELLRRYNIGPPPNRGGICIVGHPDGGIKRMDPCFIIGKEAVPQAAEKHLSENLEFIHVITQQSLAEKWETHDNQIFYDSCFFHGSSGSPVFDEDCYLIGIHTGGYAYPGEKGKTRSVMEYAYSIQPILQSIITQAEALGKDDLLKVLSESLNLNLEDNDVDDNDVDMEEDPQNQEVCL